MTSPDERSRPDGRAWVDAQRRVAERNDEARKRGAEERKEHDRREALKLRGAEQRGIYR